MKALTILVLSLALAAPAAAEVNGHEELRVVDAAANYLVEQPFPYYRHHWKVIVAAGSRLRFEPMFVPQTSKATRAESFDEAVADLSSRNAASIPLAKAPAGLGFAEVATYESAAGYDWDALRREHGDLDAVVELSRPGFDATGSFALVVSHTATASGKSSGMVVQLAKDASGQWSAIGGTSSAGIRAAASSKE